MKYCVKNGTLKIKHTKLKPNKNKKAELTISGKPLKEICLRQGAVFNTGMVSLADTAKIRIASGSEIQSKIKSQKLDAIVRSGSFCYLEGELSNLTAKVRSGSRLRCSGAIINKAYIKIAAGSFAAFKDNTDIEGKVTTGSELKLYGTGNTNPKVNTHTHGKITTSNGDEL